MTGVEKTYMTREDEEKLSQIKLYAINKYLTDILMKKLSGQIHDLTGIEHD